jgi:hypothetical protein
MQRKTNSLRRTTLCCNTVGILSSKIHSLLQFEDRDNQPTYLVEKIKKNP